MTRFARAKGSKSSNERAPEDSTPWEVMREQLLQAKTNSEEANKRKEAEQQRIENYENFLKEHKVKKRKATWCEFPEAENKKSKDSQQSESSQKLKKNKNKHSKETSKPTHTSAGTLNEINTSKKFKKKMIIAQFSLAPTNMPEEQKTTPIETTEDIENAKIIKKSKKKQKKGLEVNHSNSNGNKNMQPGDSPIKNKRNKNKKHKNQKISTEGDTSSKQENDNDAAIDKNINNNNVNKKNKKLVDGVPVRRKAINDNSFQLIINGKDVELVRFDGFPIMKKDAERLKELKDNMIKKGIPKSEVNRTLKLERRRAEKALARLKRDVCYNCRKGGHNLSDCPELKSKIPGVGGADGLCFKCGSTEHKQFECKVQKEKEFKFATCFICKEPGHIARQCPDNPKGLYPNGGGCKLCGDVTHLRKDCPTAMDKKEEKSIKLQTLDGAENLEGIEQTMNKSNSHEGSKKPKKIKF